jgi:single-strand DNA-binding protein
MTETGMSSTEPTPTGEPDPQETAPEDGSGEDGSGEAGTVAEPAAVNAVTLRGRVSTAPELRSLPSGTSIVTVRVSVARARTPMTKGSRQSSDWVDCIAWGARQRRRVSGWRMGDVVEVEGALRRRVYRHGAGTGMRLEVEVLDGRMVARAVRRPAAER